MTSSRVSIQYAGAPCGGRYHRLGGALRVTSSYGTAEVQAGALDGGALAELLLFGLVQAWSRRDGRFDPARPA
jgi:hypothetical protein